MSCSRRNFLAGSGAVIFTTGVATTSLMSSKKTLAYSMEDGAKRYGMVHDETACMY
jgi:protein NrfC